MNYLKAVEELVLKGKLTPEVGANLSVDADLPIFSWYKGKERKRNLMKRAYARKAIELAFIQ